MWNLENNSVNGSFEYKYSRFIASWTKECRELKRPVYFDDLFKEWLKSLQIPESDVHDIAEMANCGKFELETSARNFLTK